MSGFVSFVGSGPGDPELLTVKAVNRISKADAVLFDDLSAGPILARAKPSADLVGVGQRAGRKSPKQAQVSKLLVDYAKTGAQVVRLKSGDSGLFGRLEEEQLALREAGFQYEIIPGVSSASAAAAAANIPLTRRFTSRRVQFVTGHATQGDLPADLNFAALADPDTTTVVFMGKRTFAQLVEKLEDYGLALTTPALLVESVSTPEQSIQRTTIKDLAELLRNNIGTKPAIIMYGPLADSTDG